MKNTFLTNRKIEDDAIARARQLLGDDKILFAICGDLNLKARYASSVLFFGERALVSVDNCFDGGALKLEYEKISSLESVRMYGNACVYAGVYEKRMLIFRFTYALSALCDVAVNFVNSVIGGGNISEEFEVVEAAFEKALSVCPKCGRALLRPGAECIMCRSKSKVVKKLWVYIKPQKNMLLFCSLLSIITTAMTLFPPYVTKMMVDTIIPSQNTRLLMGVVFALFASYILQYGIGYIRAYYMRVAGDKTVADLRNDIYKKAQYLPMKFYDKTSTGSVINRVGSDSAVLQNFMLRITQEVAVQFFLMIGIIIIMFALNWKLTLFSLFPIPLIVWGTRIFARKIKPFHKRIWRRWSAVTAVLADSIPCIRVIKSFAGEKRAVNRFETLNNNWLDVDIKSARIATLFPNVVSFLVTCGSLIIWIIGGNSAISGGDGAISVGLLVSFVSYATMFYGPVNFFANLSDSFQAALASTERILDILEAEPEEMEGEKDPLPKIRGKIEFKNVNFAFEKTKKVLNNVNLTINEGDVVGIVGTTGSGKSTLINLLLRYYDNYDGEILVDGQNIRNVDIHEYRSKIGYVQQEPMMFSDTIFNNIAYGVPTASVEEVIHAADVANAHGFIAKLPDAYDTVLGERGVGVSGGERQRISIARAVLKNPSILVFDEATAAVDSETESLIQGAIDNLVQGRTTLMIAHRLSTLRKANRIIVVDNGEIIENGTPEELMALKGKYYKLIQIQSMTDMAQKTAEEENFA